MSTVNIAVLQKEITKKMTTDKLSLSAEKEYGSYTDNKSKHNVIGLEFNIHAFF